MKLTKLLFLLMISGFLVGCYTQIRHKPVNSVDYVVYENVYTVYNWEHYHKKPIYIYQYYNQPKHIKTKKYYKNNKPRNVKIKVKRSDRQKQTQPRYKAPLKKYKRELK